MLYMACYLRNKLDDLLFFVIIFVLSKLRMIIKVQKLVVGIVMLFCSIGNMLALSVVAPGLLIDVTLDKSNPAVDENFCYFIRYRCASIQDNCTDAYISMEFPEGIEVVSNSFGGNISSVEKNILPSGNTEVIFNLETVGMPGILEAGNSGSLRVCLKWNCIVGAGPQVPMAGSTFNFVMNPTFFASEISQESNDSPDITVPTFNDCTRPPSVPGTGLEKISQNASGIVHPGGASNWALNRPAHTGPKVFFDTIPPNTFFSDYVGENANTVELLINGTWHDIGIGQINNWIEQNFINGTLDNLVASGVQTGTRAIQFSPASPNLGSYYIEGATALRVTTPAGNNGVGKRKLVLYVDPNTAVGTTIENCFSSDDLSLGRSCSTVLVGDPEVTAMTFRKSLGAEFGESYPTSFPYNREAPIAKELNDYVYNLSYVHSNGNGSPSTGLVLTDTLPLGFDFVQGAGGNGYRIFIAAKNNISAPFSLTSQNACANPIFSKSVDGTTDRIILKWEFNGCSLHGGFVESQQLHVLFTTRYLGEVTLGTAISNCTEATFEDGSKIYCDDFDDEVRDNCPDKLITTPQPLDASIVSSKLVNGKLDNNYTKFPEFGDSDYSGQATYEMYIYNYGFEGLKKIDIVDILPHIGDFSLTTESPRNSEWNIELAAPIELERIETGGSWMDDRMHISGSILYSDSYDPCYKDNMDQIKAAENLTEPSAQSCDNAAFDDANPVLGAKAFAFVWKDSLNPLLIGEGIRIRIHVQQPSGDVDPLQNMIAWNSFAVTGTQTNDAELFSTEPFKVGIRSVEPNFVDLGDFVWEDLNGNGLQDSGEPGIPNIKISLYESNGDTVFVGGIPLTTSSDQNGMYEFIGLEASHDYIIRLDGFSDFNQGGLLTEYSLSPQNSGSDNLDNDAQLGNNAGTDVLNYPEILASTGVANTSDSSNDFGFFQGGEICGYAWNDQDGMGDQGASEPALDSVIVILLNDQNVEVQRDTTNTTGNYDFENIVPGLYHLQIDTNLVSGFIYTVANATGNDEMDSDVNSEGRIYNIIVNKETATCSYDIGLRVPLLNAASISGLVWDELSKDGIRQAEEGQAVEVEVLLLDQNGFVIDAATTNMMGEYMFASLIPNETYFIQVIPAPNILITPNQDAGMDDTIDSDVDPNTGVTIAIIPTPNEAVTNVDVGLCLLYSIGNQVWNDANNNSIFDTNEAVIPGVKIWLRDGVTNMILDSTYSDFNGKYLFDQLVAKDYILEVAVPNQFKSSNDLSTTSQPNTVDNDENGIGNYLVGTVLSDVLSIQANGGMVGGANWTEYDHGQVINGEVDNTSNPKAYYTVDFGFYAIEKNIICLPVNIIFK